MQTRPVRYRGKEYPVIDRFRVGGRLYLATAKLGSAGRRRYQVFDTRTREMRALHVLPDGDNTVEHIRSLKRLTQGDNEILQILECHREQDQVWVVLPWIDGFDLRSVLRGIRERGKQRIAVPEAVRLVKGVAHAVRHLHKRKGIVHGDIKPANLILTHRTGLVLIDYGNAWTVERTMTRRSGDGVSSAYAAPEFIRGEPAVGFAADCFSLGVVLYEILTSQLPYDGYGGKAGTLPDSVRSGLSLVPASELSPERDQISNRIWSQIDNLLAGSLSLAKADRFQTPDAWLDAWGRAMAEIHRVKQRPRRGNLIVRVVDWIEKRFR